MPLLRTPQGHSITLPPQRVSLGESAANEIPITAGKGLAAVHFHLQPWESGYFLEDAGSGLGTLVNGHNVTWAPLKHGDLISAGALQFLYEHEDQPALPSFPVPSFTAALTASAPILPTAPVPPAWLPPEALQPPLSPAAQAALRPVVEKRTRRWWPAALVLLILVAATAWAWRRLFP
jgi:Inner membrane component of T3SS, cytoplasmic domain